MNQESQNREWERQVEEEIRNAFREANIPIGVQGFRDNPEIQRRVFDIIASHELESEAKTVTATMTGWKRHKTKPREFYVDHILPKHGLTIIGGDTGMGRTWDALHLMASIEKGETWHGLQCHPAKCLYLYMENGIDDAKEKYTKIVDVRGELTSIAVYDDVTNFHLETEEGYRNLRTLLERFGAEIVFIDPLQKTYVPYKGQFDPVFWGWFENLKRLIADYTIILLHNTTKSIIIRGSMTDDKLSVDKLKCPSELPARADTVIMYAVNKQSIGGVWKEAGRYIAVPKHTASNKHLETLKVRWNWENARYLGYLPREWGELGASYLVKALQEKDYETACKMLLEEKSIQEMLASDKQQAE